MLIFGDHDKVADLRIAIDPAQKSQQNGSNRDHSVYIDRQSGLTGGEV
jgi:hypothetical protein